MPARTLPEVLHTSADIAIAAIGASLVVLVIYPITRCAAGVKGILKTVRPQAGESQSSHTLAPH